MRKYPPLSVRFWEKVRIFEGCWAWAGSISKGGYARISENGVSAYAHRVSWILHFGPVPDGLWVLHRCDNRSCVNPGHLFLGTPSDNARDMVAKGRNFARVKPDLVLKGSQCVGSKLTEEKVREVRERIRNGESQRAIARELGMSYYTINDVHLRHSWRHVR